MGSKCNPAGDLKRERALQALTECDTLTAAAKAAGISRTTLWAYLKEQDFCGALRAMQEQQALQRAEDAATVRRQALDTLRDLMQDEATPAKVRMDAARVLLDNATGDLRAATAVYEAVINRHNERIFLDTEAV